MFSKKLSSLLISSDEDDESVRGCHSKNSFRLRLEESDSLPRDESRTSPSPVKRLRGVQPLDLSIPAGIEESMQGACGGPQDNLDVIRTPRSFSFNQHGFSTSTPVTPHNIATRNNADINVKLITENIQKVMRDENKAIKDEIARNTSVLEECLELLKKLDASSGSKKATKQTPVLVPAQIKQAVRDGYKYNLEEKNLTWTTKTQAGTILKCSAEENQEMTDAIRIYVKGQYPSTEEGVIKAGIETYFVTIKQKRHMETSGSLVDHKRKMVMYGRKNRKLQNRIKSLKSKKLPLEEEGKILESLNLDYVSSEDSDSEDETMLVTRPLPWLSLEYKTIISKLDQRYEKKLNAQGKKLRSKRRVGRPSTRVCPKKPEQLAWIFC